MKHGKSKRLLRHTELATLPDVVYVSKEVLGRPAIRFASRADDLPILSLSPASIAESYDRIDRADPIGFLIAAMNGQPILTLDLDGKPMGSYVPTMQERMAIAALFADKMLPTRWQKTEKKDNSYEAMVRLAAEREVGQKIPVPRQGSSLLEQGPIDEGGGGDSAPGQDDSEPGV